MSFVRFEQVTRTYKSGTEKISPIENLNLSVERGEFVVLLGPSGSGKSTLLNLAAGIDRPDRGRIVIDDVDLATLRGGAAAEWRARSVGYVFQSHHLVPVLTAFENVEVPLWLHGMSRAERRKRVSLALDIVGLAERASHRPGQLSGGQCQRVALARAIVADPPLLIADEPTGNLDEQSARDVLTLFSRLHREQGKTILFVTHDPRTTEHASQSFHLDKGVLESYGEPEEAR